MGYLQHDLMSARVMNAIGATDLDRTICADAGIAGVIATHGVSPEVDPERWGNARYVIVWAWNPLSTAPHLWRFILEARKRSGGQAGRHRPVPEPDRQGRRRAPTAGPRHGWRSTRWA